jgi:hypothetical protein
VYENTTPSTTVGAALPSEMMPDDDKRIPVGRAAPLGETANVPPRTTCCGSPGLRSKVVTTLGMKKSGPTIH